MPNQRYKQNRWKIPETISTLSREVRYLFLTGRVADSRRLQRTFIRRIRNELEMQPQNVRLWCMLGDIYTFKKKRIACYQEALRISHNDPEANAEIAEQYARCGDSRYGKCFDKALRYCGRVDIEESIIYSALEAAREARDQKRVNKALTLGHRRFPDCSLFGNDK